MYLANLPFVASSLTFLIPFYAAIEVNNKITALCWISLTGTSLALHITKKPFYIYGRGNCIPWLETLDTLVVNISVIRSIIDGWRGGPAGIAIVTFILSYSYFMFYIGNKLNRFAFDINFYKSTASHLSIHLLSSLGGTSIIYLGAINNVPVK